MEIRNVPTLLSIIGQYAGEDLIFRGQADRKWSLLPSLARIESPFGMGTRGFADWKEVDDFIITEFKKFSAPYLKYVPESEIEWRVMAQHYGLPTSLLDWTTNPLKGLFFAVEDSAMDGVDASLHIATLAGLYESSDHVAKLDELHNISFFYSKHIDERIIAQEGCFTVFPFPEGKRPFSPIVENNDDPEDWVYDDVDTLYECYISGEYKPFIREELARLGVTHQSIFPGLDGISKSIRRKFGV